MSKDQGTILVVGAGLAGAVYARAMADSGLLVHVVEQRAHIAGNAYDKVGKYGIRVHHYGPHLFHSANQLVIDYVKGFGEWVSYIHRVRALLPDGRLVPLPINMTTINSVFRRNFEQEHQARAYLASIAVLSGVPQNAADYLKSQIGEELVDLFFRPYTRKMWGTDLEDVDSSVVKRIPLRFDMNDTYFPDDHTQIMPCGGYTSIVSAILSHPNITISLCTAFRKEMLNEYVYCFSSMSIDEFYCYAEGMLPYRSIRFHHRDVDIRTDPVWGEHCSKDFSVVNFTDRSSFTRETAWHRLPFHGPANLQIGLVTREEPCDFRDNNFERYYPIKDPLGENQAMYDRYRALAERDCDHIQFIGRCGTYQYLDMDQVINQSLMGASRWLRAR